MVYRLGGSGLRMEEPTSEPKSAVYKNAPYYFVLITVTMTMTMTITIIIRRPSSEEAKVEQADAGRVKSDERYYCKKWISMGVSLYYSTIISLQNGAVSDEPNVKICSFGLDKQKGLFVHYKKK